MTPGIDPARFGQDYAQEQLDRATATVKAFGFSVGTSEPHPQMVYKGDLPAVGRRVVVTWTDTTNIAAWQSSEEIEDFARDGAWVCRNTGWVAYADDECIVVSARRSESGHWGLSERIPRPAITKVLAL